MSPVLVVLHAHPDDEAIFTGGTIVRAVRAGWRVVLAGEEPIPADLTTGSIRTPA